MKYSTILLVFLGHLSHSEAILLEQKNPAALATPPPVVKALAQTTQKAAATVDKAKPVQTLKVANKKKPEMLVQGKSENMQTEKSNFLIENKVKNELKAAELEKMEAALKQATLEAHKQREALSATHNESIQNKNLLKLQHKQNVEQESLKKKLAKEEEQRLREVKEGEEYSAKIQMSEMEKKNMEKLVDQRAYTMKLLQAEEAMEKTEAEKEEQEFLQAQAKQEIKAAAAKRAAQKANIARIKRKHELARRNAEAKLKMFKMQQEAEAEQLVEQEKQKEEMAKIDNELKKERELTESVMRSKMEKEEAEVSEAKSQKELELAKSQIEAAKRVADESKELAAKTKAEITAKVEEKIDQKVLSKSEDIISKIDKPQEKEAQTISEKFMKEKTVAQKEKKSEPKETKVEKQEKPEADKKTEKPAGEKSFSEKVDEALKERHGGKPAAHEKLAETENKTERKSKVLEEHQKMMDKKIEAAHQKLALTQQEFSSELDNFSVSLNDKHYTKAMELRQSLMEMGDSEPKFKVHAKEDYRKMFAFPQIANNDFAMDLFDQLENTESNLAQNPDNAVMKENFIKTSMYVAAQLKDRYGDQWVNPRDTKSDEATE